jgi:hypothetical protein
MKSCEYDPCGLNYFLPKLASFNKIQTKFGCWFFMFCIFVPLLIFSLFLFKLSILITNKWMFCPCYQHPQYCSNWRRVNSLIHRYLSNIDFLMACTAYLVCFISTVNGCSKKKEPIKTSASSGHIANLKQSILETFDIYGLIRCLWIIHQPMYINFMAYSHKRYYKCKMLTSLEGAFWGQITVFLMAATKRRLCKLNLRFCSDSVTRGQEWVSLFLKKVAQTVAKSK